MDKAGISVIFGVKNFFQYLYGNKFTLFTEIKSQCLFFSSERIHVLSSARMQRYTVYLQTFQ